jgi:hypothetical protein
MDTPFDLLGLSKEELQERVIESLCDRLLSGRGGEDGDTFYDSPMKRALDKAIHAHIDGAVAKMAEEHVLPRVTEMVENITLQATNQWGEKKGEPMSFVEYMVQRADAYLREEVDYEGQSKEEKRDSYGWKKYGTRAAALVHKHLHYRVEEAMKAALANANHAIVGGLEETVKIKLQEVAAALKVEVKTGR